MSRRREERLGDSNVLDTLDFEAILRDNAGLARMVEHHMNGYVSQEMHDREIENERESAYDDGYVAGLDNADEAEVTLRPSERGTRIMASNGHSIDAEAARLAYMDLQRGVVAVGQVVGGYDLRSIDSETIQIGCTKVSRAEVEYLALAMGWTAHEDGKVVREVSPVISERPDYQSGYEAGVQSMRDRLAGVLDATVTRSEGAV